MREIKFRAWDNDAKRMVQNYAHSGNKGRLYVAWEGHDSDLILMQYTGLKDKNEKEIYMGDILKRVQGEYTWISEVGTVKGFGNNLYTIIRYRNFDANEEGYIFGDFHFKGEQGRDELIGAETNLEIIGNIYENPELLK